jgi:hypothetical protein
MQRGYSREVRERERRGDRVRDRDGGERREKKRKGEEERRTGGRGKGRESRVCTEGIDSDGWGAYSKADNG